MISTSKLLELKDEVIRQSNIGKGSIESLGPEHCILKHVDVIELIHSYEKAVDELIAARDVIDFYSIKNNWVDIYAGANLPLNLRKQSVIKNEDINFHSDLPGYENECGGKRAREHQSKYGSGK